MTEMAETHVELNQFPVPRVGPRHSTIVQCTSCSRVHHHHIRLIMGVKRNHKRGSKTIKNKIVARHTLENYDS